LSRQLPCVLLCLLSATVNAAATTTGPTTSNESTAPWWEVWLQLPIFSFWKDPALLTEAPAQPELAEELASPCMIAPLPSIEDATAQAFESGDQSYSRAGLTPATARALDRFQRKVLLAGGTIFVTSAWRPAPYQAHLQQVWDKWMLEARNNFAPECSDIRSQVSTEFSRHGLLESQRPASFSDHTRGTAFDAVVSLPRKFLSAARRSRRTLLTPDTLALSAGLHRPVMWSDPVHFRLIR
jgi:D-alanyl-D-alanine dipeptidase